MFLVDFVPTSASVSAIVSHRLRIVERCHVFRRRTYLLCEPEYFTVSYEINAWMDASVPVDVSIARSQWTALKETYENLGHTVHTLAPVPGLPDMVYSANGAFSVDGVVYGAQFAYPERTLEAIEHAKWYAANGWDAFIAGTFNNEGEGDFTYVPGRELILAGHGFRTVPAAHAEAQDVLQRQVVGLHLVDERFYHLDVALFVLDDNNICYFPAAFSAGSQKVLQKLFPDAVIATEEDALVFGLNSVSDGKNVVLPVEASALATRLADAGFIPVPVSLSELLKGGGSVKCCTAELRS